MKKLFTLLLLSITGVVLVILLIALVVYTDIFLKEVITGTPYLITLSFGMVFVSLIFIKLTFRKICQLFMDWTHTPIKPPNSSFRL